VDVRVPVPALDALAPVPAEDDSIIFPMIKNPFRRMFRSTFQVPAPGIYHYLRENGGEKTRLHLRIDGDGSGILVVNAARIFHFNPTAMYMAFLTLEGIGNEDILSAVRWRFKVSAAEVRLDHFEFSNQFKGIIEPDSPCPVCEIGLETFAPFSKTPTAPYRMDLALTYRCNNDCSHCYNARPRKFPELVTADWIKIIDQLWKIGIPHIVFTGGEPTLRNDLPELIARAESNGQITGINTNGRKLGDAIYLKELLKSGLDHIQITMESHNAEIHDRMVLADGAWEETVRGIRNALDSQAFVMTNTTLLQTNSPFLAETLDFIAGLGVKTVGINALIYSGKGSEVGTGLAEADLPELLDIARNKTGQYQQRLIWYTPTRYCQFDPTQMELGVKGCTAALYNMCIEPDGSVIPCQSYYHSLGKLLEIPWGDIWNHELAKRIRQRSGISDVCQLCDYLPECGGGCPLSRDKVNSALVPFNPHLVH
jgi:radical SAM protein with 4Fe4S-binding SPASM domain